MYKGIIMAQQTQGGPVGEEGYLVRPGDCIESIGVSYGLLWQTIWDAGENAELKSVRKNPNVLLPGDRVFIPEKANNQIACGSDSRHTFVRKGVPSELRLTVRYGGQALANTAFAMNIDGVFYTGETSGDGEVIQTIHPDAKKCHLKVGEEPNMVEYELQLGQQDPIEKLAGIKNRLINLGYDYSECRGEMSPATIGAIREFQSQEGLDITGEQDQATRDALKTAYGC
jgi:hypothetical protein